MKIAFVAENLPTVGGIIIPFQYCRELRKRGYEARVHACTGNRDLEEAYGTRGYIPDLKDFTDEDVIIAVWWPQVPELEQYKGRKFQFVQGNDLLAYQDQATKDRCLAIRQKENWEIIAVSDYAGSWTGRDYTVIPNAIDDRFFVPLGLERDIDALVEGNNEPNKNIPYAIKKAKEDGNERIVWLGRETTPMEGVECITNPKQEDIPAIYQRSKKLYKYSLSEGFCLPIWEAVASGCEIHTWDMGGNNGMEYTMEQAKKLNWENTIEKFLNTISLHRN